MTIVAWIIVGGWIALSIIWAIMSRATGGLAPLFFGVIWGATTIVWLVVRIMDRGY